jgi:hypothetical protein
MKSKFLLCAILLLSILGSCSKNDDLINTETTSFVPDNIVGKALILFSPTMKYTLQASAFTSYKTCTIPMISSIYTETVTPSYTYSKTNKTQANLVVKHTVKGKVGTDYWFIASTYTVTLTFTSELGGTYNGTDKAITTGNVSELNGTSSSDIYGTFSIY